MEECQHTEFDTVAIARPRLQITPPPGLTSRSRGLAFLSTYTLDISTKCCSVKRSKCYFVTGVNVDRCTCMFVMPWARPRLWDRSKGLQISRNLLQGDVEAFRWPKGAPSATLRFFFFFNKNSSVNYRCSKLRGFPQNTNQDQIQKIPCFTRSFHKK